MRTMSGVWPTYMIVYLLGTVFMVANIFRCLWSKQLFNPPSLEESKDETERMKVRIIYGVAQGVMLIIYIVCFINFKNLAASMIGFAAGVLLPIAIVFLFDMYLECVSRKLS